MRGVLISVAIIAFVAKFSSSASVFSCDQGCKDDSECPNNSHCVAINQNSECGMCLCKAGYKTQGNNCVPNKPKEQKGKGPASNSKETTTASKTQAAVATTASGSNGATTSAPADSASSTTQAGPTTQGSPPTPAPVDCANFNCPPLFPSSSDGDNPFTVRSALVNESALPPACRNRLHNKGRTCKMSGGGGVCYGIYCLTVEPGKEFCICEYNKIDRQCAVDKPGKCESANSQLPQTGYKAQNKRFINKNNADNGSIYARHFAPTFDDCVKLCSWASSGCRSVNYGPLAGQQVCELLSVVVTQKGPLDSWLVDAQGWQYATVSTGGF